MSEFGQVSDAELMDFEERPINVLFADWDDRVYDTIHDLQVENRDLRVVGISTDCNSAFEGVRNFHPDVIVASYNLPGMSPTQFVTRLVTQHPHIPVLMTIDEEDSEHLGRLIHAGAKDVLVNQNTTMEDIASHIRRVYREEIERREAERAERKRREEALRSEAGVQKSRSSMEPTTDIVRQRQQVIAFYSPKGGVGTSIAAMNTAMILAKALARSDVREESRVKICLIDADFGYGNLDSLMMLPNKTNIYDVIQTYDPSLERFDQHAIDKAIIQHPQVHGLDILLAPNRLEYHDFITGEHIRALIRTLREREYDIIIFDTSTDLRETTIEILTSAQKIMLFVTQDIASVRSTEQVVDVLTGSSLQVRRGVFRLILSMMIQGNGVVPSEISEHLKIPIGATIPDDRRLVTTSINTNRPIALGQVNPVLNAYKRLAGIVSPELGTASGATAEPERGGFLKALGLGGGGRKKKPKRKPKTTKGRPQKKRRPSPRRRG